MLLGLAGAGGCSTASAQGDERLQGVVEFDERAIGFELGGRIRTVGVRAGDDVDEKTELARLDDSLERPLRAVRASDADVAKSQVALVRSGSRGEDIRATRAQLEAARRSEKLLESQLARQKRLVEKGAVPESRLDDLDGQLSRVRGEREALEQRLSALRSGARREEIQVAEARVKAAESAVAAEDARLEHHVLGARMRGRVLDVHVEPGEVVAPGAPVVTIADVRHPYADVFVPQGGLEGIRVGAAATIRVDSLPALLHGKVENVSRRTEFTPRFLFSERERPNLVVRVRVRIEDPTEQLHAGVPAFVSIDRQVQK